MLCASCWSCAGHSVSEGGSTGNGGNGSSGTAAASSGTASGGGGVIAAGGKDGQTSTACTDAAPAPTLEVTPNCSGFAPNLGGSTVDFVSADALDAETHLVAHHFSAPASASNGCGFELTVSLPFVTFNGQGTYNLNAWWAQANGRSTLQSAVLLKAGESEPSLGVAVAGAGSLLSNISAPIAIQALGPDCQACPDSADSGLKSPVLSLSNTALTCTLLADTPSMLGCHAEDNDWFVIDYCAAGGATDFPAVYGRLTSLIR